MFNQVLNIIACSGKGSSLLRSETIMTTIYLCFNNFYYIVPNDSIYISIMHGIFNYCIILIPSRGRPSFKIILQHVQFHNLQVVTCTEITICTQQYIGNIF
uniref:Uncharacterized protein n=1 Tax=Lepeophtheirus salmonis TaxID=72036 RepID=A0A0K2TRL6_LEPSM